MSQSIDPPWLREESYEPLQSNKTTASTLPSLDSRRSHYIFWCLKISIMILCVLMFVTAVVGLGMIGGVDSAGKVFIAVYMIFFSVLLFLFELIEIKPIEYIDNILRRNFGFLYGAMGKSFYIIFIAFLSFGLGDPEMLSMISGSSLAGFGILQLALYLKYPELFE